jgi:hypothetical protein
MPLKRVALSTCARSFEPRSQPPYAETLLVQVGKVLVVTVEVEELAAPPPPIAATDVGEEWAITEMAAP